MSSASVRLACLWVSQSARVLADWCLRVFVIKELAALGERQLHSAWYLVAAVCTAPFIVLAPLNGALGNALSKGRVLAGSALFCLVAVALCALLGGPWLMGLALMAVGMAVYSPTRYALLPAAALDTGLPLPRVSSWIEMGGSIAIVAGAALGLFLHGARWPGDPVPAAVAATLGLCAVGLLAALPVRFPSDVRRPEPPARAVAGFFRDARRVFRRREARWSLAGLAGFMALVTAGSGALFNSTLDPSLGGGESGLSRLLRLMAVTGVGAAAGSWLAGRQGNLRRCLGLVPFAATGLLAALFWLTAVRDPTGPCLLLGLMTGLANVPLRSFYQAAVPADARGNGMAVMNTTIFAANTLLSLVMFLLAYCGVVGGAMAQLRLLALLTIAATLVAWWALRRMVKELLRPLAA